MECLFTPTISGGLLSEQVTMVTYISRLVKPIRSILRVRESLRHSVTLMATGPDSSHFVGVKAISPVSLSK